MKVKREMSMNFPRLMFVIVFTGIVAGIYTPVEATPIPSGSLRVSATLMICPGGSPYNPRTAGEKNFVGQLVPNLGRFPVRSSIADIPAVSASEHRMTMPFRDANATTYLLATGGSSNDNFTRLDYGTLGNPVTAEYSNPAGNTDTEPNSFDWVDNDTIIFSSYEKKSGVGGVNGRLTLHLADVTADPFSVTKNTTWNADGAVLTGASTRIRNVTVGDVYNDHAYYGSAGEDGVASFFTLNLATGTEKTLGSITTSGDGSFGLWTVKESDGYLYVHTTDDGIQVYNMTDAATLGSLYTTYSQSELEALSGHGAQQSWGFDVSDGGARMLYTNGYGTVLELVPEPAAFVLFGISGLAMIAFGRRRTQVSSFPFQ